MSKQYTDHVDGLKMIDYLRASLIEEVKWLRKIVREEDSDCLARVLRKERLRAYEHVLAQFELAEDWDYGVPIDAPTGSEEKSDV